MHLLVRWELGFWSGVLHRFWGVAVLVPLVLLRNTILLPANLISRLPIHVASVLIPIERHVPILLLLVTNRLILPCLIVGHTIATIIIIITIVLIIPNEVLRRIHHVGLSIASRVGETTEPARVTLLGQRSLHFGGWNVVIVLFLVECPSSH